MLRRGQQALILIDSEGGEGGKAYERPIKKRVGWEGGGKEGKKMGLNVACVAGGLRFWAPQTAGGWVSRRLWKKMHAHGLTKAAQGQIKQTNE